MLPASLHSLDNCTHFMHLTKARLIYATEHSDFVSGFPLK